MHLDAREQALLFELMEALSSSLELPEVMHRAQGILTQLLPAEYVTMCVSKPGQPTDYDWLASGKPTALFTRYREFASEDFVREAVVRHPNIVLRDSEMLPRNQLQHSALYQRCRELGLPLEHVMAVLLDVNQDWHVGLTLYRERHLPFSKRDRALFQRLTPFLARTVRNCRLFSEVSTGAQVLDALLHQQNAGCLVLIPPSTEKLRTAQASRLVDTWFTRSECDASGLPTVLLERLRSLEKREEALEPGLDTWVRSGAERNLKVTFVRLPAQGDSQAWALVLQEFSHAIPLPADLRRRISKREAEIVSCVLSNWSNELIARELGLTLNTVKTHLRNIFPKLGVENRTDLIYQAAWRRKPL
ncbi:LuxR C-terminal-related transcriptional regulator [Myxococcaceae bacterium GXIMD 01537]